MKTENQNGISTLVKENQEVGNEVKISDPMEEENLLEDETDKISKQLISEREEYLRLAAEYDNYRRRTKNELKEAGDKGKHSLLERLITIADDFELAVSHSVEKSDQMDEGLKLIQRKFLDLLLINGVTRFSSLGETFDPEIHEAFDVIAASKKHKSGTVHSEVRGGYFWKGKLLRPAIVVVAQ